MILGHAQNADARLGPVSEHSRICFSRQYVQCVQSFGNGDSVTCESLRLGQQHGLRTKLGQRFRGILLHRDELEKIEYAQAPSLRGQAARGQCVIGAGDVIAHRLRRIFSHEDAARIADPLQILRTIDGEVFGREQIHQVARLGLCLRDEDVSVRSERLLCNWIECRLAHGFAAHGFSERRFCGDEDGERGGIVFRLCDQVGGDGLRVAAVAENDNLGRSGEHVNRAA